jgi:hypothetical protein
MQKWEYLIVTINLYADNAAKECTERINRLGANGWELVGTSSDDTGYKPTLFFKRPKD